jgi:hypothetical protein
MLFGVMIASISIPNPFLSWISNVDRVRTVGSLTVCARVFSQCVYEALRQVSTKRDKRGDRGCGPLL